MILFVMVLIYMLSEKFRIFVKDFIYSFPSTWDEHTNTRINELHPNIRRDFAKAINEIENKHGLKVRLTDGYRSIEEQNNLYAKGRSEPGQIVTNAEGGQSYHNYGLAGDVVAIKNGQPDYSKSTYQKYIYPIFQKYGFKWGGSFGDYPHFYKDYGYDWEELQAKVVNDQVYKKSYPLV
jgi:peptidoglycan L-alanyl-D-glutamate endopeptidase CwlK